MSRAPRRWIVRYRKSLAHKWSRAPRFITPITGYRTKLEAHAKLRDLHHKGYSGHVAPVDWLRTLAMANARRMLDVREQGGNNAGPAVEAIIHENGGETGEPWCGDFVAKCYRDAGSTAVTRSWAAVRLLGGLGGMRVVGKRRGETGDLVRFTFDHVGIIESYCNSSGKTVPANEATHMRTIEGNTGKDGAVSDSSAGGDGVHRRRRSLDLVQDCVVVLR